MKSFRVADHMTMGIVTLSPDMEILHAVHLLVRNDISGAPVLDADGALVGILTERDCLKVAIQAGYHGELGGRVAEFMSSPVETVCPDEGIHDLAERFLNSRFRRFPVMQGQRMVGLISRRDALRALRDIS